MRVVHCYIEFIDLKGRKGLFFIGRSGQLIPWGNRPFSNKSHLRVIRTWRLQLEDIRKVKRRYPVELVVLWPKFSAWRSYLLKTLRKKY